MNQKKVKKIRQMYRRENSIFTEQLMRDIAKLSRWERLKFCYRLMKLPVNK